MDCVCFVVSKMLEFFGKRQRNQHKFEQTLLRNLSGEDSSFGLSDIHRFSGALRLCREQTLQF